MTRLFLTRDVLLEQLLRVEVVEVSAVPPEPLLNVHHRPLGDGLGTGMGLLLLLLLCGRRRGRDRLLLLHSHARSITRSLVIIRDRLFIQPLTLFLVLFSPHSLSLRQSDRLQRKEALEDEKQREREKRERESQHRLQLFLPKIIARLL